jgi:hypothetical protein
LLGQNLAFYFRLLIIEQTRCEKHFSKPKMALLAQIGVSFCNIESRNDNVVWFFAIFYVYNMLTQVLDHSGDFYVEQEVFYMTFSLKNCVFCKGEK